GEFVGSVFEFSVFHVDGHVCHTGRSHRAGINRGKLAGFDNGGATIPIWPNPSVAGSITRRYAFLGEHAKPNGYRGATRSYSPVSSVRSFSSSISMDSYSGSSVVSGSLSS